jgi:hypothetical protein
VHHHYSDKAGLVSAVSDHLDQSEFLEPPTQPTSPAEIVEHIRAVFPRLDGRRAHGPGVPAPRRRSGPAPADRRASRHDPHRARTVESCFDAVTFDHLTSIVTVLCTSETVGRLEDQLDLTITEAAEAVAWAVTKLSKEES